jgi:hypothetical protein
MVMGTLNKTGWGTLDVETSEDTIGEQSASSSALKAYAAGFIEGHISAEQINLFWQSNQFNPKPKVVEFVNAQNAWMEENVLGHSVNESSTPGYWDSVGASLMQLRGLADGYNAKKPEMKLTYAQFEYLQLQVELGDIERAVYPTSRVNTLNMSDDELMRFRLKTLHCSAIFKVTSSLEEVYASHVTWSGYTVMSRMVKTYTFPFESSKAKAIKFSGYPGTLAGIDDFYITSQNLAVIETTNGVYNNALFDNITPATVPYWVRVMVANRLASSSPEWHSVFYNFNSGTYNNQWMTFDYKLFQSGKPLVDNTFVVSEQLPGHFHVEDQTMALQRNYWPSYNEIFYEDLYKLAGYPGAVAKYGVSRSYQMAPRARIFRRDAGSIESLGDLEKFMRMNHYKNSPADPLAPTPVAAISARGDLLSPPEMFGAIDGKIVSSELMKKFQIHAISGPTHETQSVFSWSPKANQSLHYGQPLSFPFQWIDL